MRICPRGGDAACITTDDEKIAAHLSEAGRWDRLEGTLRGDRLTLKINGTTAIEDQPMEEIPAAGPLAIGADGPTDFANIYVRDGGGS